MSKPPCPCCDIGADRLLLRGQPEEALLRAFALGVALGSAFSDMHAVTELCCSVHRTAYILAAARTAVAANTTDDDDCDPDAPLGHDRP